jgi:tau tubulin kinase
MDRKHKISHFNLGEIYQSKNVQTGEDVALKIEKVDTKKQVLKLEVAVLKKLQGDSTFSRQN